MLKRTGTPTRLRSWRETEHERIRLKIRERRPSPSSGTSRTQRGVRPMATIALIIATKMDSYDLSNGRFRKTLRFRSSCRVLTRKEEDGSDSYTSRLECTYRVLQLGLSDPEGPSDFGCSCRTDNVHSAVRPAFQAG